MNHFPVLLQRNLHAQRPVRACFARSCCNVVVQEHDLRTSPVQCNVKQALSSHITLHPSHFTSDLFSSGFMSSRTADDKSHAAIPMRSATGDSKTPYNYAHTQAHPKQLQATVTLWQKKNDKPTAAATVAHTRYLSLSPAATLHGKTQGFVLRLPPQNIAHATSWRHYNAVRSINLQTCTYLRTEQHQNSRRQESCSHSNAICNRRFQNTL